MPDDARLPTSERDVLSWSERTRLRLASTPEGRAALAEVAETQKFLGEQPCSQGNCVELIDSRTGENTGGWGPVGCACQDDDTYVLPPGEDQP